MKKFFVSLLIAALAVTSVNTTSLTATAASNENAGVSASALSSITIDDIKKGNPITGFDENDELFWGGDPSILVDGDTVYLYIGHDVSATSGYNMPDWRCYSTTDMENWTYEGEIMSAAKSEIKWTTTGNEAWAGQVMKHNGLYYLYYCTSYGSKSIGVSVADTPTGWSSESAKAEYCDSVGIDNTTPSNLHFVDIGHPLVVSNQTWPNHAGHDDIDPTAWIETDDKGVEHRYLGWGNSFFFLCELNDDMISVKDLNEDGLITMKTTRSLLTVNNTTSVKYSDSNARSTVIDGEYGYPEDVKYTDFEVDGNGNYSEVSKTIPKGSEYLDGDIICSKFYTKNTTGEEADTVYTDDTNKTSAVDNDGKSLAGQIRYNDDGTVNGLFTYSESNQLRYHFFTEAPYIYRRQDANGNYYGKYYLFNAVDWREQMAYSVTDDLSDCNWEFKDVIMPWSSTADTNHPAVFDFKGHTYFIYHNGSLPFGFGNRRSVCVEELNFDENGDILPIEETATGLTGTTSWLADANGAQITHQTIVPSKDGADYPMCFTKAKTVSMEATEDANDSKWQLVSARAQDYSNDNNYVSIEAWNNPGLYLSASASDVVLSQLSTADYKVDWSNGLAEQMTFKVSEGLNGKGVSFESLAVPGMYLTSDNGDVTLTDGSDVNVASFDVTSRAPLNTVSAAKTKTTYNIGEAFNANDLTVTAAYKDGKTAKVTDYTTNAASIDTKTAGTKTLTVTYREDNFIRTADVKITVAAPVTLKLDKTALSVKAGASASLKATVTPAGTKVTWATSNAKIASVTNGVVKGIAAGTATITAKAGNKTVSCKVTVTAASVAVSSVKLNKTAVSLTAGKTYKLTATLAPSNATNKAIKWTSSKASVASVNAGKVTAKKAGKAVISATASNGKKATCTVTVKAKKISAKKVKLSKTKVTLKVKKSIKLKATLTPKNSTDSIKWTSSKKAVAIVKDGKVTAKKKGSTVIKAKASSGKTATCKVTVK